MRSGPSRQTLRCVAAGTMFIDHIGVALFPGVLWLRCVGRLAFPIFAFFLAEGFRLTHSRKRYLQRLVLFALLAELPFDRMTGKQWVDWSGQNVLWTLALGLCAMACVQRAPREPGLPSLAWLSAAAGCCLLGLHPRPAEEVLDLRGDVPVDVLRIPVCLPSGNSGTFGGPGDFVLPSAGGLPGPPELPAALGSVWVLLVLPFAHAAFSPLQLGREHVTDCNGAQKGKRQTYPGGNCPRPVCSLLLPGPDGLQKGKMNPMGHKGKKGTLI